MLGLDTTFCEGMYRKKLQGLKSHYTWGFWSSSLRDGWVDQCYTAGRYQHFPCPWLILYPMPDGLHLVSSRNQVLSKKSLNEKWQSRAALGMQDIWSIGTFTIDTKSRRHNYEFSPFMKKTIYYYNNSQTATWWFVGLETILHSFWIDCLHSH